MHSLGIFLTALALLHAGHASWEQPWFCHDIDCPRFTNASAAGIEIRAYTESRWVKTNLTGATDDAYEAAVEAGFRRLFRYISGENAAKAKIPMTAPVLVTVHPGAGPNCNTTFTVAFFVPFAFQAQTPEPSSPAVFLEANPAGKVAVLSYGGRASGWETPRAKLLTLAAALQKQGIAFDDSKYATAGYDSPFRLLNRHNEVWYFLE
eukprot:EG_transcript_26804